MKIFKSKHKLRKEILNNKNISFVPTMGGLHKGHEHLINCTKSFSGKCLVSIFINPKQFNKKNDYTNYPRNIKKDLSILNGHKVDYVYIPNYKDIFSFKAYNKIYLDSFSKKLCGNFRKRHFLGVVNVVNRFLEIIKPKYIFLGLKDFQQLILIKNHIKKKKINTKVVDCKIIREANGVACSTRNNKIDNNQMNIASNVYNFLKRKKKMIKKDLKNFNPIAYKKELKKLGLKKIDYIELYNLITLKRPKYKREKFKIFIAYYLNKIRLIDNI